MNVVFISPNFPPNFHHFCTALKNAGANVLGLGDSPHQELNPALLHSLTEYYHVPSLHDYDALHRALGWFVHKHGRIERLESWTEFWLESDARLREDFNIPGQKPSDLKTNRSKVAMKKTFRKAGVPTAPGIAATSGKKIRQFVSENGYPVIVKPDLGVGALGTYRIDDDAALAAFIAELPKGYVIEQMITGDLVSFDGLTDRAGNIVFSIHHQFSSGIMEVFQSRGHIHYLSDRGIPKALEDLGRKVVAAFGVKERFFHIEFFRTGPDQYQALEINVRPPGGFTLDLMNLAADINLYQWWADIAVNGRTEFTFERKYHTSHVARRRHLEYEHSHEEIYRRHGELIVDFIHMPAGFADVMGDTMYMLRSPDEKAVRDAIADVESLREKTAVA